MVIEWWRVEGRKACRCGKWERCKWQASRRTHSLKDIVRGRFRFLGGEVDVATVVGDKNVLVFATRFHLVGNKNGQLTSEVGSRRLVAGNSTDERGQGNPRGKGWKNEERRVRGRVGGVGFWRSGGSVVLRLNDQGR